MSIERFMLLTKLMMEIDFSHMYVDLNCNDIAGSCLVGQVTEMKILYIQENGKFLAICRHICIYIYIFLVTLCVPFKEQMRATSGTRAVGWPPLL